MSKKLAHPGSLRRVLTLNLDAVEYELGEDRQLILKLPVSDFPVDAIDELIHHYEDDLERRECEQLRERVVEALDEYLMERAVLSLVVK